MYARVAPRLPMLLLLFGQTANFASMTRSQPANYFRTIVERIAALISIALWKKLASAPKPIGSQIANSFGTIAERDHLGCLQAQHRPDADL